MMNTPISSHTGAAQAAEEPFTRSDVDAVQAAEELKSAVKDKAQEIRRVAQEKTEHFRNAAQEQSDHFQEVADATWQEARTRAEEFKEEGEHYIRQNPGKAILAAVGVGFVLGLLLKR